MSKSLGGAKTVVNAARAARLAKLAEALTEAGKMSEGLDLAEGLLAVGESAASAAKGSGIVSGAADAAAQMAEDVTPKIALQHRTYGTFQIISAGFNSGTGIRFSVFGEKMFVEMWEVAPGLQNQGVGTQLFREALAANPEVTSIRGVAELDNLAALKAARDVAQTPFAGALAKLGFTKFYAENSLGQRITDFSNIPGEVTIRATK